MSTPSNAKHEVHGMILFGYSWPSSVPIRAWILWQWWLCNFHWLFSVFLSLSSFFFVLSFYMFFLFLSFLVLSLWFLPFFLSSVLCSFLVLSFLFLSFMFFSLLSFRYFFLWFCPKAIAASGRVPRSARAARRTLLGTATFLPSKSRNIVACEGFSEKKRLPSWSMLLLQGLVYSSSISLSLKR